MYILRTFLSLDTQAQRCLSATRTTGMHGDRCRQRSKVNIMKGNRPSFPVTPKLRVCSLPKRIH